MAESRGAKEPLDEDERDEGESWLKTQHSKNKGHGFQSHHFMENGWGKRGNSDSYFLGFQNHCGWWLWPWNWKILAPWKKNSDNPRQCIKKWRHHFADKSAYSQSYGFSSSHVWMWELNLEGWVPKNWCFWIVVLENTLESPLDSKEFKNQSVLKESNPEYSWKRLILKLKLWYFGHLMRRSWIIGKDPDARKDWGQEEKGVTEHELVGWHHWLNGHEFEQTLGDSEGQGSLVCCSPWGCKELDLT